MAALTRHLAHRGGAQARSPYTAGDDAALVLGLSRGALITSDMLVQDVDFRSQWARWSDVGHKAATSNLSDIAAMGATPRALLASLAVPASMRASDAMAILLSLDRVGRAVGAPLIGGDVSAIDGPVVVSVTAIGAAGNRVWCRGHANVGDVVCVTAPLGAAGAGLAILEAPRRFVRLSRSARARLIRAQLRPRTPSSFAVALCRRDIVTSAADVSDGLVRDAMHLPSMGAGIAIDTTRVPIASDVLQAAKTLTADAQRAHAQALTWALSHGEEYALVLSVEPANLPALIRMGRARDVGVAAVGRVVRAPGLRLWPPQPPGAPLTGFAHFSPAAVKRRR